MDAGLIRLIRQRANGCCEYCRMPEAADDAGFLDVRVHGLRVTVVQQR
jgi:hypothetical protein